jgi:transposase
VRIELEGSVRRRSGLGERRLSQPGLWFDVWLERQLARANETAMRMGWGRTPRGSLSGRRSARPRKKRENRPVAAAAENQRRRGRPGRLTPELADAIVTQISAGTSLAEAARLCGLGPRTLRSWRRRAWSREPVDAAFVALERRVQAALATRPAKSPSWEQVAAALEREYPERWGPPDETLDDLLARLDETWLG